MTATATADEPTTQPAATGRQVRCDSCRAPVGVTCERDGMLTLKAGGIEVPPRQLFICTECGRRREWRPAKEPRVTTWKLGESAGGEKSFA